MAHDISGSKIIYSGNEPEIADDCIVVGTGKEKIRKAEQHGIIVSRYYWDGVRDGQAVGGEVCVIEDDADLSIFAD